MSPPKDSENYVLSRCILSKKKKLEAFRNSSTITFDLDPFEMMGSGTKSSWPLWEDNLNAREPVDDKLRPRVNLNLLFLSLMSSSLNWPPKVSFILSTMFDGLGSHGGRVHALTVLWVPFTRNGRSPSRPLFKRKRRRSHVGQQRFDNPITRP